LKLVAAVLEGAGFDKWQKDLDAQRHQLAEDANTDLMGGPQKAAQLRSQYKRIKRAAEKFPQLGVYFNGVAVQDAVNVNFEGRRDYLYYAPGVQILSVRNCYQRPSAEITERWEEINRQQADLCESRNDLEHRTLVALKQFTTVAKLQEGWPEIAEFLPEVLGEKSTKTGLPAVRLDELNTALGLPRASK